MCCVGVSAFSAFSLLRGFWVSASSALLFLRGVWFRRRERFSVAASTCGRDYCGASCLTLPEQSAAPDRKKRHSIRPFSAKFARRFLRQVSLVLCVASFSWVVCAITLQVLAPIRVLFPSRKLVVNFMFQSYLFT